MDAAAKESAQCIPRYTWLVAALREVAARETPAWASECGHDSLLEGGMDARHQIACSGHVECVVCLRSTGNFSATSVRVGLGWNILPHEGGSGGLERKGSVLSGRNALPFAVVVGDREEFRGCFAGGRGDVYELGRDDVEDWRIGFI